MPLAQKLTLAAIATCAIVVATSIAQTSFYVYPNAETKSAFFTGYSPYRVVEGFRLQEGMAARQSSADSAAGRTFASHHELWQSNVLIKSGDEAHMMASLQEDALSSLTEYGAYVVHDVNELQNHDLNRGFSFRYFKGNTNGVVSVEMARPASLQEAGMTSVGPGTDVVALKIG